MIDDDLVKEENNDDLAEKIYDDLEERFYISTFRAKDEIIKMIKELNYDQERIESWVDSIML